MLSRLSLVSGQRLSFPLRHVCGLSAVRFSKKKEEIQHKIEAYDEDKEMSSRHRLKILVRDYGASAMVVHISVSLLSLGVCYLMVRSGLPLADLLYKSGLFAKEKTDYIAAGGTFAFAYIIHKSLLLFRVAATVAITPLLVNTLRSKGILKPLTDKAKTMK